MAVCLVFVTLTGFVGVGLWWVRCGGFCFSRLAIVGLTDQFVLERIKSDHYETHFLSLRNDVVTYNPPLVRVDLTDPSVDRVASRLVRSAGNCLCVFGVSVTLVDLTDACVGAVASNPGSPAI